MLPLGMAFMHDMNTSPRRAVVVETVELEGPKGAQSSE